MLNRFKSLTLDLLALLLGALVPLSFAPFELWPLAYLSLAGLFWIWSRSQQRAACLRGWLFGLGMFGIGVSWVQVSIHQFGLPNLWFSASVTFGFVCFLAIFPALAGYFAVRFASIAPAIILFPALWTLSEWLRCWLFTGFPWLLIGYGQIGTIADAWAPVFGVLGVTWFVAIAAGLLTVVLCGGRRQRLLGMLGIGLLWGLAAALQTLQWTRPNGEALSVAIVQGNVAQEMKWRPEQRIATLDLYRELSEPHWERDLLIWPETAIPAFSFQVSDYLAWLELRSKRASARLLLGIPVYDAEHDIYFNSILAIGASESRYDKRHLVPFGEYLPFRALLGPILDFLTIPMSQFSPGPANRSTLHLPGVVLGASVCYEDAFAELVADAVPEAELLVNVSNDAWFGDSFAPHQHMQIARMRARETERYMLRATNTGISALIDQRGEIEARSKQFEANVLTGEVIPLQGETPFTKWRHWPVALACLFLVFGSYLQRRRTRPHVA